MFFMLLSMTTHPTQILLHNPLGLRIEYLLDEQRLILWWSPKAGESFAAHDRNFSNRDDHLEVFASIELAGCGLGAFERCEFDPYHSVLFFTGGRELHLAPAVDQAVVYVWSNQQLVVDFKTARYDQRLQEDRHAFTVLHPEPAYDFHFTAQLGHGSGYIRHCEYHGQWASTYVQAQAAPEQLLAIGVGLADDNISKTVAKLVQHDGAYHVAHTNTS